MSIQYLTAILVSSELINFTLQLYLPGASRFYLVFWLFFIFLDKTSELSYCFNEASSEIGSKINKKLFRAYNRAFTN